jgi:hypothetical protein
VQGLPSLVKLWLGAQRSTFAPAKRRASSATAITTANIAISAKSTTASFAVAQQAKVSLHTESAAVSGGLRIVRSLVRLERPHLSGFACWVCRNRHICGGTGKRRFRPSVAAG